METNKRKNTKANAIKLLKEMDKTSMEMARIHKKDGDEAKYREYMTEAIAYWVAASLLEDAEFFNEMANTFFDE